MTRQHSNESFPFPSDGAPTPLERQLRAEATQQWQTPPDHLQGRIIAAIQQDASPEQRDDADDAVINIDTMNPMENRRHWLGALGLCMAAVAAALIAMILIPGGPFVQPTPLENTQESFTALNNDDDATDGFSRDRFGALVQNIGNRVRDMDTSPVEQMLLDEGRAILGDVRGLVTSVGERVPRIDRNASK